MLFTIVIRHPNVKRFININQAFKRGLGKTTYPLSANANVLSATPRFPISAFLSNYDVNIPLSSPIMILKHGSYVSMVPAGREQRKVRWRQQKVDTLIYPDPFKRCSLVFLALILVVFKTIIVQNFQQDRKYSTPMQENNFSKAATDL